MPVTVLYAPGRGADLNGTACSNQWRRTGVPVPWETSEAHQVTYLDRLFAMMEGRDVRGAVWLFLHPLLDDGTFDARVFGSISLRDETGAKRPVYDAWAAK